MPEILLPPGIWYYSARDEDLFFAWLTSIPGVVNVVGTPGGLRVMLRSRRLSQAARREFRALCRRYGVPEVLNIESRLPGATKPTRRGTGKNKRTKPLIP